ncbi:hypothetical protein M8756_08320 [Lutimaribacter sp. EGI FJ00015]|uniref:Uncharacterized protein n=1 Tax=Lutimaribacter degradans TaxID=2945989 RepID=A0ACC5ZW40_9RHOB|nr:hypothetical protein [Lutimaribacter sp. EGI FJ00013]MCM2562158.1 hypothetical protein [Lutimaribacter sp. EGI FJ00013]MCO0613312.1 hypothetical protein [Lutimaribacter sp. EGI FJ00015]
MDFQQITRTGSLLQKTMNRSAFSTMGKPQRGRGNGQMRFHAGTLRAQRLNRG